VKTLERDGFGSGGLQPGIAPSTTYARLKAASTYAGRVFTQTLKPPVMVLQQTAEATSRGDGIPAGLTCHLQCSGNERTPFDLNLA